MASLSGYLNVLCRNTINNNVNPGFWQTFCMKHLKWLDQQKLLRNFELKITIIKTTTPSRISFCPCIVCFCLCLQLFFGMILCYMCIDTGYWVVRFLAVSI